MEGKRLSDCFNVHCVLNKIFGLWPGREDSKYYTYFSLIYVVTTYVIYCFFLTLNLFYTPYQIELIIHEVIFFFTEIAIFGKVFMVLFKRREILKLFQLLDSELFKGNYDECTKEIIESSVKKFQLWTRLYIIFLHNSYASLFIVPVLLHWIYGGDLNLPVCQYYFLSDQVRNDYLIFWYMYQSIPIYGHMIYDIANDTFIAGFIYMATIQLRLLNYKLSNLKLSIDEKKKPKRIQDEILMAKLMDCLKHYRQILEYCAVVENIISVAIFCMFGVGSIVVCITVCVLILMPVTAELKFFMVGYLIVMVGQLFIPTLLGSGLVLENRKLVFAAMKTDWIGRPKQFLSSLILFMGRANNPLVLCGMNFFPLVLSTFISIMKTAYSFITLVRNIQNHQTERA